jgi:membrane protein DedA with SNARE-associated domain
MHQFFDSFFMNLDHASAATALAMICLGMLLESTCVPLPSELVLPVAGYCAFTGKFGPGPAGLLVAIVAALVGSLLGSALSYAIGYYGGYPFIERYGRYLLMPPERVRQAEEWLERRGSWSIAFVRLVFGVRHLSSLAVGIVRAGFARFMLFTAMGCLVWDSVGVYLGYRYGEAMQHILRKMSVWMFVILVAVVALGGGYYFWKAHHRPAESQLASAN